jgi:hypothetical protein
LAIAWVPQMIRQRGLAQAPATFLALLFILVFLGGGLVLLYKVIKNEKTVLSITSEGLSYGLKVVGWEDVLEIGIMQKYVGRNDLYFTTQADPYVHELLLSTGLSSEQIRGLFGALRDEVMALHPNLHLEE